MFAENTDKFVTELINGEYHNARKQSGNTYENHNESKSVISEELTEANSELNMLDKAYMDWRQTGLAERAVDIYRYCRNAIKELSQVAAVALKIIDSTNPDKNPMKEN